MKMWHINSSCFRANCLALITVDIDTVPIILLAFLFCNDILKERNQLLPLMLDVPSAFGQMFSNYFEALVTREVP